MNNHASSSAPLSPVARSASLTECAEGRLRIVEFDAAEMHGPALERDDRPNQSARRPGCRAADHARRGAIAPFMIFRMRCWTSFRWQDCRPPRRRSQPRRHAPATCHWSEYRRGLDRRIS